jgi:hypothetical protein
MKRHIRERSPGPPPPADIGAAGGYLKLCMGEAASRSLRAPPPQHPVPVGEFRHMQRAEAYGLGAMKAHDGGGSCWGHPAVSDLRTAFGKLAGDVLHVLVDERDAV